MLKTDPRVLAARARVLGALGRVLSSQAAVADPDGFMPPVFAPALAADRRFVAGDVTWEDNEVPADD
ncbi:hypothetical protein GCM10027159_12320 [Lysobacter terrae]